MVGSHEKSKGGITTVIKLLKQSSIWDKYQCYWLGTQIQGSKWIKLYYCIKAYMCGLFLIWKYDIIHFHAVPDISLLVQFPIYILALVGRKKIILHLHVGNQIEYYKNNNLFLFCIKHSNLILLLAKNWEEKFNIIIQGNKVKTDYLYNAYSPVNAIDYTQRTKTIIFAAHLNANKAYDILLKGFKEIAEKYPEWKLIIMGDGEVTKARDLVNQLNLDSQVEFTGYIIGQAKQKYFQEASIYCMCSYQEGFPMVVIEAWAYGIPVITTPVGGLPDVLEEGKNATIFEFGDYIGLASRMKELIENPYQRKTMSEYSQKFVADFFSVKSISSKLDKLYKSL